MALFLGHFVPTFAFAMLMYGPHVCNAECRNLDYLLPVEQKALKGHVIKSVDVSSPDNCMVACFLEERCVSTNVGPSTEGSHVCELSDSDDVLHPEDLEEKQGHVFRASKNPCNKKPCPRLNTTCLAGFTDKGYVCHCTVEGYTGEHCEDIDECATKTHQCDPNALCTNTKGSYDCACKAGFTGDGLECSDINECESGSHGCHANATCKNKEGSHECVCSIHLVGDGFTCSVAKNCLEIYNAGKSTNGVYTIDPDGQGTFQVYCLQDYKGGGFVVFQSRSTGSVDFYLGWDEYKNGFGDLTGEFWLGLDKIHRLTNKTNCDLHVRLKDWDDIFANAIYDGFKVGGEDALYKLNVASFVEGSAGDSLTPHNEMAFSTKDSDNDKVGYSCSQKYEGAWWYNQCHSSNLNGRYHHGGSHASSADRINWKTWKGYKYSAKECMMIIRPAL